jgi:hypothetical protein
MPHSCFFLQGLKSARGNSSVLAADLVALVERLQSNVETVQLCAAYYVSHAYTQVRNLDCNSTLFEANQALVAFLEHLIIPTQMPGKGRCWPSCGRQ